MSRDSVRAFDESLGKELGLPTRMSRMGFLWFELYFYSCSLFVQGVSSAADSQSVRYSVDVSFAKRSHDCLFLPFAFNLSCRVPSLKISGNRPVCRVSDCRFLFVF